MLYISRAAIVAVCAVGLFAGAHAIKIFPRVYSNKPSIGGAPVDPIVPSLLSDPKMKDALSLFPPLSPGMEAPSAVLLEEVQKAKHPKKIPYHSKSHPKHHHHTRYKRAECGKFSL